MSDLTHLEKRSLENVLDMHGGFVLDFNDRTFKEFFQDYGIAIHDDNKYTIHGTSKAKRMRAFWEQESNQTVAKILTGMLKLYEVLCDTKEEWKLDAKELEQCRNIVQRLSGKKHEPEDSSEKAFLKREYAVHNIHQLPIASHVSAIIQERIDEAQRALSAKAWLAVIFLCGSALEGILLGIAERQPERFKEKPNSIKRKKLHDWTLSEHIDAAYEAGLLELNVKKFSHDLRDFRNYIHPYAQIASNFTPTEQSAKICLHVLKAAVANLTAAISPKTR